MTFKTIFKPIARQRNTKRLKRYEKRQRSQLWWSKDHSKHQIFLQDDFLIKYFSFDYFSHFKFRTNKDLFPVLNFLFRLIMWYAYTFNLIEFKTRAMELSAIQWKHNRVLKIKHIKIISDDEHHWPLRT